MPNNLLYRANRPALHFSPNDPIGSRSTGDHLELLSINNRRTATIFIRFLAYFPEANLSSTSLPSIFWKYSKTFHQQPENIQRLFINNPEIFKDFLGSSNQQQATSSSNQQQSTNSSNQQQQPAINQQQQSTAINQQQQSTAATSNQPTAAINSSNQQQQLTAATSISNQQQQLATTTSSHPTSSIHTIHDDFR